MNKLLRTLPLAVPAVIAGLVIAAPSASADTTSYLNDLRNSDYGFTGPISGYVYLGNQVCSFASQGFNQGSITDWVVRNSGSGIYDAQASYIVVSAEVYLC